ncbi:hypothetical protein ML462_11520 [Gramella lutea]|uniref:4-alpha-L-fucosyltransferase glycosyl transferase group 56 n=1 Tax=Christiangramia lutea TaxID=1607951 RepID=A0A9X1V6F1_9FLAO|nr:hypothetical protein [Christiangramia lutea]MCH4823799.1 hypothetical protein [Christiangramia lutea]
MNIHLVDDQKFINQAIERTSINSQKQNIFICNVKKQDSYFVENRDNVSFFEFSIELDQVKSKILETIENTNEVKIFVHYLEFYKAKLINEIFKDHKIETYWIFYGNDLYKHLYRLGRYDLFDKKDNGFISQVRKTLRKNFVKIFKQKEQKEIKQFIFNLDFFCFWNIYDYELLTQHFKTKAEFRNFRYDSVNYPRKFSLNKDSNKYNVLVNHSASASGNHLSILNVLNRNEYKNAIDNLYVPLNYGNKENADSVNTFCEQNFRKIYYPILNFLPKAQYYELLDGVDVAFFGHRRQEAGNNINYLLNNGVKVYLREDNNLLKFYKNIGVYIFSFEKDLKKGQIFSTLSHEKQQHNHDIVSSYFSDEVINGWYKDLLN